MIPAALVLLGQSAWAAEFTQADLEKMVKELEAFAPKNDKYKYPIHCKVVASEDVNAYATADTDESDKDGKPQSEMVVYTGLVKTANGDPRLIRAVVAHEISHLSNGHVMAALPTAKDLNQFWTRAQESEADRSGAVLLQKAGYSKQDMVDMLLMLEKTRGREGNWFGRLTGTHPDPKARAAAFMDDPHVMKSLLAFDIGLAFLDRRDFGQACIAFNKAADLEPLLTEAVVNSAQSKLMQYYDELGSTVRKTWWRPDFGPVLKDPSVGTAKDDQITDQNRQRYAEVQKQLGEAAKKLKDNWRIAELQAIANVLEPDGKADVVKAGVDWLTAENGKAKDESIKLRLAANAAVGLQRLHDVQGAYQIQVLSQQGTRVFNSALAENLGRVTVTGRSKDLETLSADVLYTWLKNTPKESPNWEMVFKNYEASCKNLNVEPSKIEAAPLYLTSGITIQIGDKQLSVLESVQDALDTLGAPDVRVRFDNRYPDITEVRWQGGDVQAYTGDDQLLRVTSYVAGSYVLMRPVDDTIPTKIKITVGMTEDEFKAILDINQGVERELSNKGQPEKWLYYSPLSLGVLIENGKVKGVTVTPVREYR